MNNEDTIKARVLIVEDDQTLGTMLVEEVEDFGLEAHLSSSAEAAVRHMEKWWPDLVVCDLRLPGMDGLDFLRKVNEMASDLAPGFLIITAFGTIPKAVEALKAGAEEFLTKPLDLEHFMLCVRRIIERKRLKETVHRMRGLLSSDGFHGMCGQSTVMRRLFDQIRQVAKAQGPVLIFGETGSGKELVAKAIHHESHYQNGPFLPVNCAGIPEQLMESEFFGHTAGAFTGAQKTRQGLFAEADGGSLLLDEISEMPLFLQAKLLRILQDGKLRKIGDNREYNVNVRILAATHRDLEEEVREGHFREDLLFRLETFTVRVPPLRERGEDLELLSGRFLKQFALSMDKTLNGFSSRALELILNYPFPGNIRELRNVVERAVAFSSGNWIRTRDLPAKIRKHHPEGLKPMTYLHSLKEELPSLAEVERRYIQHVLDTVGGNKRQAASILGIGRRTLYRRLGS